MAAIRRARLPFGLLRHLADGRMELLTSMTREVHNPVEIPHCPHCLSEVHRYDHFCVHCSTPLTAHAATGPIEQVWALGSLVNRLLSDRAPSRRVVLGTWLIALPSVLMLPAHLLLIVSRAAHGLAPALALVDLLALLVMACYLLLALRVTRAHLLGRDRTLAHAD